MDYLGVAGRYIGNSFLKGGGYYDYTNRAA